MKPLEAKNILQTEKDKTAVIAMQSTNKAAAMIAFNQIYKRYKNPIFYEVMKFVKMNKEVAEDLTQEIFVKVFQKVETFDFSVVFSTWLYNVAKNHVIDFKRKQKIEVLSMESLRAEFGGDEEVSEVSFQLEDKSADTFNGVVRGERAKLTLEALSQIKSDKAREIIQLIFIDDISYEKVAEQVEMPIGTVKALMFRAKIEMKEFLSVKSRDFEYGRILKENPFKKLKVTSNGDEDEQ